MSVSGQFCQILYLAPHHRTSQDYTSHTNSCQNSLNRFWHDGSPRVWWRLKVSRWERRKRWFVLWTIGPWVWTFWICKKLTERKTTQCPLRRTKTLFLCFSTSSPSMLTASSANSCTERCMPRLQGTKNVKNVPKRLTDRLTVLAEEVGWEQHLCHRTTDLHMQSCRLCKKIMLARTIKKSFSCASSTSYSWTISEIWSQSKSIQISYIKLQLAAPRASSSSSESSSSSGPPPLALAASAPSMRIGALVTVCSRAIETVPFSWLLVDGPAARSHLFSWLLFTTSIRIP